MSKKLKKKKFIAFFFFLISILYEKTCSPTGCLKTKNDNIILEEYTSELFEDHRKDYNVMRCNFAGPSIMKNEIKTAIRQMKLGKATGPDIISVELIPSQQYSMKFMTQVRFPLTSQIYIYCTAKETRGNRI